MDNPGREVRLEFWQTLWVPFISFAILRHIDYINMIFFLYNFGSCAALFKARSWEDAEARLSVNRWLSMTNLLFPGLPTLMYQFFKEGQLHRAYTDRVKAWETILVNAALLYSILLFFVVMSRRIERHAQMMEAIGLNYVLMIATGFGVQYVLGSGLIHMAKLQVYFKTVALAALICCAPNFYPGLSRRSARIFWIVIIVGVIPITIGTTWLLIEMEIAAIHTIVARVDQCTFTTGIAYFVTFAMEMLWNRIRN